MPTATVRDITMNYETAGSGEPLILLPYLSADNASYAFQLPELSQHYACVSVDLRGAGESDKPEGPYSTEQYADDVAALMAELGIDRGHVLGVSLGGATAMWLAAKYPDRVASLSLHSTWPKTDAYLAAVINSWRVEAKALGSIPDFVIQCALPWCFTPALFVENAEMIAGLEAFVRSRPVQPVEAFLSQTEAVLGHDAEAQLGRIEAPTQITFGKWDLVTSTRFEPVLTGAIKGAELVVFDHLGHLGLHEDAEGFNKTALEFLFRQNL
jgi:pimeloyl-ACP methyl ester carboxylesterase